MNTAEMGAKPLNAVELGIIKFMLARFKSKSPKGYAIFTAICGLLASAMLAYIAFYNLVPVALPHWMGVLDNIFIVIGAALTSAGIVSKSTTTDPTLISKETKDNVITHASEPLGPQQ